MNIEKKILIYGAGAIGRGFIPWCFKNAALYFVDVSEDIVHNLKQVSSFKTYMNKGDELKEKEVVIAAASTNASDFSHVNFDAVFVAVGPRNCFDAISKITHVTSPIILLENDRNLVDLLKKKYNLSNIYFAIPDVITSNSAPKNLLKKDPLSTVTENGVLYIDSDSNLSIPGDYVLCDNEMLSMQWDAKLYLHNTPHCIAAYLGFLANCVYLHEAMLMPAIENIVSGAMQEMLQALNATNKFPSEFLRNYANKELNRFRSHLLHDPILRVAREPIRKLNSKGRLVGAAYFCLSYGVQPLCIIKGILSALLYTYEKDNDAYLFTLYDLGEFVSGRIEYILRHILEIDPNSALGRLFENTFHENLETLTKIFIKDIPVKKNITECNDIEKHAISAVYNAASSIEWNSVSVHFIKEKTEVARDIVTDIDLKLEAEIFAELHSTGIPILSEETQKITLRNKHWPNKVWVLDPIDGTVNLAHGMPDFCISLGMIDAKKFSFGCIYAPLLKKVYVSANNQSYCNRNLIRVSGTERLEHSLVVMNMNNKCGKEHYELFALINNKTRGCLRIGSAALSLAYFAEGKIDVVVGFNKIWDVSAGFALAKYAGGIIKYVFNEDTNDIFYIVASSIFLMKCIEVLVQKNTISTNQLLEVV